MRDQVLQTPKRDHQHVTRRSKYTKKITNVSQKCLDSAFTQASEDAPVESPNDSSCALSTISEISTDHLLNDDSEESLIASFSPFPATPILSDETPISTITSEKDQAGDVSAVHSRPSFTVTPTPLASPLLENGVPSELTPSSTETVEKHEVGDDLVDPANSCASGVVDAVSLEAEMVVNYLKQARSEVVGSNSVSAHSKRLLDSLLDVVMEDLNALPEEEDRFAQLCAMKSRILLLSFLLWVFAAFVIILFGRGDGNSFIGHLPT